MNYTVISFLITNDMYVCMYDYKAVIISKFYQIFKCAIVERLHYRANTLIIYNITYSTVTPRGYYILYLHHTKLLQTTLNHFKN